MKFMKFNDFNINLIKYEILTFYIYVLIKHR
jgi:hypothetical protein